MPSSSLALLQVLSVRINKAVVLGSDMTRCFITFLPPISLAPLPGCSLPGEGEGRHRTHPLCRSQGKGKAGGPWPPLLQRKEPNTLWFSLRSSPELPWGRAASQSKLVFCCSFPPDEVRICFHRIMFKILLVKGLLYFSKAFKMEIFLLRSSAFLILSRGEILPLERFFSQMTI